MHFDQRLIVFIVYYFQIRNKKEHNIIISSRLISNHMGPMYLETPYVRIYSNDIRIEFGIEKCAIFIMKIGKRETSKLAEVLNQEII